MKFMPLFDFFSFKLIFFFLKIAKKRVYLPVGADVASGTTARADVACGTPVRMRCGAEATWQGRGWPMQHACGAQGTDTWQEAMRVHVCPGGRL